MLEKDIQEVLFTEEQLARRVGELAHQITQDYQGREIVLISVLRGSFVFMADLCRRIDLPCTVDFMSVSSYGTGTSSSGQVQITKDLSGNIEGKDILVVEDILDSGNTLSYLLRVLEQRGPASVRLCTLLDKPDRRVKPVEVHYSGFTIRLHHSRRLCGGLRSGLRRALPQSALHWNFKAGGLRGLNSPFSGTAAGGLPIKTAGKEVHPL